MTMNFLKNQKFLLLSAILLFVVIFSFSHLTTRPKLWYDEGLDMEMARNFLLFHKLDISTAPNVFSGAPYAVGTNGYPLIIPLAGVYSVFGFGLAQTRIYMLFWLIAALLSLYYFVKHIFGANKAIATVAFVAIFAPFYGNGLTAFGEIPGFFFLIWGLFFLIKPERINYLLVGLFFGLAAATKPSLYLLLFPTILIFLFLEEKKSFFQKISKFILGALPPILSWIILTFPNPLSLNVWKEAVLFYRYPFGRDFSIADNVVKNIGFVFTHSTLIYFLLITLIIIFWFFKTGRTDSVKKKLSIFFFTYSVFAFLYFLKSPARLRYILGFELLAFIFVPAALETISQKFLKGEKIQKIAFRGALALLLFVQLIQLFFFRSDFYSPYPEIAAAFVNENLAKNSDYKVGIINTPEIACFIDSFKKFHIVKVGGPSGVFGENPLAFPKQSLPKFIVFYGDNYFIKGYDEVLKENYFLLKNIGGYLIYELKYI